MTKTNTDVKKEASKIWKDMSPLERAKEYLENSGYPFEFETAEMFVDAGFEHSDVYLSERLKPTPDGKVYEIDVVAHKVVTDIYLDTGFNIKAELRYNIECKYSKEEPWIILANPNETLRDGAWKDAIAGTELAKACLWHKANFLQSEQGGLFDFSGLHGRSVVTAVPRRKDGTYKKLEMIRFFIKQLHPVFEMLK